MIPVFNPKMFVERRTIRNRMKKEMGFVLIPRPYEYMCSLLKTPNNKGKLFDNLELVKNPYYEFEKEEFLAEFPEHKNKLDRM